MSRKRSSNTNKGKSLTTPGAGGANRANPTTLVRGPADVAAMIPYLLGFQPHESLVLVALEGRRKRFGPILRVDLVHSAEQMRRQADQVVDVAVANRLDPVLVIAFGVTSELADPLVGLVLAGLSRHHIAVEDAFRADGSRWWSYVCRDPLCCSPDGAPYDVTTSRIAAEAVFSGLCFEADRDALRANLAPAPPPERREVMKEVRRLSRAGAKGWSRAMPERLDATVTRSLEDPSSLGWTDVAWLSLAVSSPQGRDGALARIDRENAALHFELWRHVMCRVDDELVPSVGCLAAFSAWLDGRGVLASHAVDRVLAVDPDHRLASLIGELVVNAVSPRTWPAASTLSRPADDVSPPLSG